MNIKYEIVSYDSVILLTQGQNIPFPNQNIFNPIEFARSSANTNMKSMDGINKWMMDFFNCMVLTPSKEWRSGIITLSLVLHPQHIELANNDFVISLMEKPKNNIAQGITLFNQDKFVEIIQRHSITDIYSWLRQGFKCRVLLPGKDWQYGKVKLSFVFHPDDMISEQTEFVDSSFPLDEIRKVLAEAN